MSPASSTLTVTIKLPEGVSPEDANALLYRELGVSPEELLSITLEDCRSAVAF